MRQRMASPSLPRRHFLQRATLGALVAGLARPSVAAGPKASAKPAAAGNGAAPAIRVNVLGYLAEARVRAISGAGGEFRLLDAEGRIVHRGEFQKAGGALGEWFVGNVTGAKADGAYHVESGDRRSIAFAVGASARDNHLRALRAAAAWFRTGRANYSRDPGKPALWMNDGVRSDDSRTQDFVGGWQDTGVDQRKFAITNAEGVWALLHVRSRHAALWKDDPGWLLTEARWGSDWLHKMQDPQGFLYYGIDNGGSGRQRWPDPKSGEARKVWVDRHSPAVHFWFIAGQAWLARELAKDDAAYAAKCLESARRCLKYCLDHFDEMNRVESDPVRRIRNPQSDMRMDGLDTYALGIAAGWELYRTTDEKAHRDLALDMARRFMALQVKEPPAGSEGIHGFFYQDDSRTTYYVPKISMHVPMLALCDLIESIPGHADAAAWRDCLKRYVEGFLAPLADRSAFGIVPYGVWKGKPANPSRQIGDLYFRYFKANPEFRFCSGRWAVVLTTAAGLARAARVLDRPAWRDLAWRQVDWVLGVNPLDKMPYGINPAGGGQKKPLLAEAVAVPNGICGDAQDMPTWGSWPANETWIPNNAGLLAALVELL
jgi:hypothetical protein